MADDVRRNGTVNVTFGEVDVVGNETTWEIDGIRGGMFSCQGLSVPIWEVTADDALELAYAWKGTDSPDGGEGYAIMLSANATLEAGWLASNMVQILRNGIVFPVPATWTGTDAERTALAATLNSTHNGKWFVRSEPGFDLEGWRWLDTAWVGPFAARGGEGEPGLNGAPGLHAGVPFAFDDGLTGDPGTGRLAADDADLSEATALRVSKTQRGGSDIGPWLLALAPGSLGLLVPGTNKQALWTLGAVTDHDTHATLAISGHSGETAFANDLPVTLQHASTGPTALTQITEAEFAALVTAETLDPALVYNLTDAGVLRIALDGTTYRTFYAAEFGSTEPADTSVIWFDTGAL